MEKRQMIQIIRKFHKAKKINRKLRNRIVRDLVLSHADGARSPVIAVFELLASGEKEDVQFLAEAFKCLKDDDFIGAQERWWRFWR